VPGQKAEVRQLSGARSSISHTASFTISLHHHRKQEKSVLTVAQADGVGIDLARDELLDRLLGYQNAWNDHRTHAHLLNGVGCTGSHAAADQHLATAEHPGHSTLRLISTLANAIGVWRRIPAAQFASLDLPTVHIKDNKATALPKMLRNAASIYRCNCNLHDSPFFI
jgi:hypothetical protein